MEKADFERKLEKMTKPEVRSNEHHLQLKLTLLNAKKSARIGVAFVILPCVFLFLIFLKYALHLQLSSFTEFEDWMSNKNNSAFIKLLIPLLLIGTPLIAFIINALSILHFDFNEPQKELLVTIKIKWFNIIILVISAAILLCFLLYAAGENF
jgi:hypothetical protein